MKMYCMCEISKNHPNRAGDSAGFGPPDNQYFMAPNRFGVIPNEHGEVKAYAKDAHGDIVRPVLLQKPMVLVQMGVPQEVTKDRVPPNAWNHLAGREELREAEQRLFQEARQHFPNVDVYRCPNCGAIIVLEG